MKTNVLVFVLVVTLCLTATAQDRRMQTGGSVYQSHMNLEAQSNWNSSKKLGINLPDKVPMPTRSGTIDFTKLKEGDIGTITRGPFVVVRIVNKSTCILSVGFINEQTICLAEYDTNGLVDGDKVHLVGPLKSLGTSNEYGRTMHKLRFLTTEEMRGLSKVKTKSKAKR